MIDLAAIRRAGGMTQVELATAMGVKQASISKIERQSDWLISTVTAYLTALDATAELVVRINDQVITQPLVPPEPEMDRS